MAITETTAVERAAYISWSSVIAGAVAACAVSSVLLAFASTAGFSFASTAPTWRDASFALWLLSGLVGLVIALLAFGLGGYIAGRARNRVLIETAEEFDFRDGLHGLLAWGLAVVLAGVVALVAAHAAVPAVSPPGVAGPTASVAGENLLATELDTLFRTTRAVDAGTIQYTRGEAARILLKASGRDGITSDDHDYLTSLVAARAGVGDEEAAGRVDNAIHDSQVELTRARAAAVIGAFMTAVALLVGAAAAWYAAHAGGRDRESNTLPWWSRNKRRAVRV